MQVPEPDYELPAGYQHIYSGKVRDLWRTPDGELLFVASDRISAYDHILSTPIPDKGRILTAVSLWWFDQLSDLVPNHVVSTEVPDAVAGRAMICHNLEMAPIECVARGYLTGSGIIEYQQSGSVCGVELPEGLIEASQLPEAIYTPATKAELGDHDENISFERTVDIVGKADAEQLRELTLSVYTRAEQIARDAGLILADTKFEFGRPAGTADGFVLADEVLTPDSSRYWPAEQYEPGKVQPSFDKQFVRNWLTSPESGWDRSTDTPPPPLPDVVVEQTREKYAEAYRRLTGKQWVRQAD